MPAKRRRLGVLIVEQWWLVRFDQTPVLGILEAHHIFLRYKAILNPFQYHIRRIKGVVNLYLLLQSLPSSCRIAPLPKVQNFLR